MPKKKRSNKRGVEYKKKHANSDEEDAEGSDNENADSDDEKDLKGKEDYKEFLRWKRNHLSRRRGYGRHSDSDDDGFEKTFRDDRDPLVKARGLRKYHERFLKKYHDWEANDDYRREERRFGSKRFDLEDEFDSFRSRKHRRLARSDSDDEDDHHIGRRHKAHRDLDDLDKLDKKVEGINKKLKSSLNKAEGEPMPEEPVKDDKKDEKKDKK